MVARSNEDGEEACTCVNLEKPRSNGNAKKSNSNRSTSDDEAIFSAACHAQSNDGQIIEVGKLNYRDHIPAFTEISAPQSHPIKKGKPEQVQWNEAQQRGYSLLK